MIEGFCHCGAVRWRFDGTPPYANSCNCTVCRRYGTLWAYGREDDNIAVSGPTRSYVRDGGHLGFHFCPECGGMAYWRALAAGDDGRRRIAVNLRLADPAAVAAVPVHLVDGIHDRWESASRDGLYIADLWF